MGLKKAYTLFLITFTISKEEDLSSTLCMTCRGRSHNPADELKQNSPKFLKNNTKKKKPRKILFSFPESIHGMHIQKAFQDIYAGPLLHTSSPDM